VSQAPPAAASRETRDRIGNAPQRIASHRRDPRKKEALAGQKPVDIDMAIDIGLVWVMVLILVSLLLLPSFQRIRM